MSLDTEILKALRSAGNGSVSGAELSQSLRVTRAAIWGRIEALRALGYDVVASPHQGYRLLSTPDLLHADDLTARLGDTHLVGRDIRVFAQTTSTNDVVEKLARDGVSEGVVVFAESQTKGRGRLGRKWMSPSRKGLWFSVLLRPNLHPSVATQVTVGAAVALRRAIQKATALDTLIKWPNDILVRNRKVAGILTELRAEMDQIKYIIVGMGVDVNLELTDLPEDLHPTVTSLRAELGKVVPRAELAVQMLRELDVEYGRILAGEFSAVSEEWQQHCATIGQRVSIWMGGRNLTGRAEALADDGALLLRTEHGHLERVVGGDVVLEKANTR